MIAVARNLYELFGLSRSCGTQEIRDAHNRWVRTYHPDLVQARLDAYLKQMAGAGLEPDPDLIKLLTALKDEAGQAFEAIQGAYETLRTDASRHAYEVANMPVLVSDTRAINFGMYRGKPIPPVRVTIDNVGLEAMTVPRFDAPNWVRLGLPVRHGGAFYPLEMLVYLEPERLSDGDNSGEIKLTLEGQEVKILVRVRK